MRSIRLAFLLATVFTAFACAKAVPITTPTIPSDPHARGWLTLEEEGRFVGWVELTKWFPQEIFKPEPRIPAMPDVKDFSSAFLAETSVSADGVVVVRSIGEPFVEPFRKVLNEELQKRDYPALSPQDFEEALKHSQLTCHGSLVTAEFGSDGTPLPGEYACIAGLECVNNLLFSLSPPENEEEITASISVLDWTASRGTESLACRPKEEWEETVQNVVAEPNPRLVTWGELLPILQGVTSLDETDTKRQGVAACNIPPKGVNMVLVVAATRALNRFADSIGGTDVFLNLVAGNGSSPPLWGDSCLPWRLEPFLGEESLMLLGKEEFQRECETNGGVTTP